LKISSENLIKKIKSKLRAKKKKIKEQKGVNYYSKCGLNETGANK
jgi:hypothetical protein